MRIVSFREPVYSQFSKTSGQHFVAFEPHKPYVMSNSQYARVVEDPKNKELVYRVSSLEARLANFNVQAAKPGSSVLFWTGAGGFGDQIMAWPVAQMLHRLGFKVHVMTDPGNLLCWWGFPWAQSVFQFPTYLADVLLYDHQVFFETVTNADEHPDQPHPVDAMLARIGVDPAQVDPDLKVARPAFTAGEIATAQLDQAGRDIGIYQLSAAGRSRSLEPGHSAEILKALASAFPAVHWIALVDPLADNSYRMKAEACGDNVAARFFKNIRELWALASQARVVVSPDSMMVHVAGAMDVPCVGLWGPVDPKLRVKYYKNHTPLWSPESCHSCPCFQHSHELPDFCPTKGQAKCGVLEASAQVDAVVEAVKAVLA